MIKEVIKKTVGKKFTQLTPEERKEIVKQVKKIPEFAKKTKGEIRKILNKVFTKLPTKKYKKKERGPVFDITDTFDKNTMVGRVPPKQQMTKNQAMDLDLFEVPQETIDKNIMKNTLKKSGGGSLKSNRSYRGYGAARKG
jgi:hypothetical protein